MVASNRPLRADVDAGRFRVDLFYRLSILAVELAPLRDRAPDVPTLAQHFLAERGLSPPMRFSDAALEKLSGHEWPGNIRELRNLVERAGLIARDGLVQPSDVTFV
jgi:DNA-binding NtrC family response regulator